MTDSLIDLGGLYGGSGLARAEGGALASVSSTSPLFCRHRDGWGSSDTASISGWEGLVAEDGIGTTEKGEGLGGGSPLWGCTCEVKEGNEAMKGRRGWAMGRTRNGI